MKKQILLSTAMLMIFSLTSCGDSVKNIENPTGNSSEISQAEDSDKAES